VLIAREAAEDGISNASAASTRYGMFMILRRVSIIDWTTAVVTKHIYLDFLTVFTVGVFLSLAVFTTLDVFTTGFIVFPLSLIS